MDKTILYIKNMVCPRCIKVVGDDLKKLDLEIEEIVLGKVIVAGTISGETMQKVKASLEKDGFKLLVDKRRQLVEGIKNIVIEQIHYSGESFGALNYSQFIANQIGHDYSFLSNLFSEFEGITIEKYIIHQKIEKAKELIAYGEHTLSEIADQLGYSSVQYLSNQFKKITGLRPSDFKNQKTITRYPIDNL